MSVYNIQFFMYIYIQLIWYLEAAVQFKLVIFSSTGSYSFKTYPISKLYSYVSAAVEEQWTTPGQQHPVLFYTKQLQQTDWCTQEGKLLQGSSLKGWRLHICDILCLSIFLEALH